MRETEMGLGTQRQRQKDRDTEIGRDKRGETEMKKETERPSEWQRLGKQRQR